MASAYSPSQIQQYEEYISLPPRFRQASNPPLDAEYLTALHIHQLSSVPYENLLLHYSTTHAVSLDPQVLFKKIVTDARGRGGYCMENSIFFNHVLKALGFTVYMTGVRIRPRIGGVPGGDYTGWVHIVNIVTLPSHEKYMLDVGFGGDGATKPLPLISGHVTQNLGTQEVRLIYSAIPQLSNASEKLWIYQYRNSKDSEWNSFYSFPEIEFFAADFEIMNFYTSQSRGEVNSQINRVLVIRFLRGEGEGVVGIVGKVMLVDGEVKRNDGGRTRVVTVCKTEEERVRALREHFAIELVEEEIQGIRGGIVELLGT